MPAGVLKPSRAELRGDVQGRDARLTCDSGGVPCGSGGRWPRVRDLSRPPPIADVGPGPLDCRADVRPGGEDGAQDAIKSQRALDATDEQTTRQTSRRHRTAERRVLRARCPWYSLAAVAAAACATSSRCCRASRRSRIGGRRVRCAHRTEPDQVGAKPTGVMCAGEARYGKLRPTHGARTPCSGVSWTRKAPPRLSRAGH